MHIIQRGNNRGACFRQESDYLVYLSNLRDLAGKHDCAVHAYCLMTNHVHLLVTPGGAQGCACLMRDLGRRYVRYFNRRHERSGTLWEGRFRSCVAQSARYVMACYRYIESNPVRAGMVDHAAAYRWSSHAANSGMRADVLVTPHTEYLALSTGDEARHAAYRGLFENEQEAGLVAAIRDAIKGGYPLASDAFKANVLVPLGARTGPGKRGPKTAPAVAGTEEELRL